ncbi:hypothetical protein [Pedobacter sp. UYEF25]
MKTSQTMLKRPKFIIINGAYFGDGIYLSPNGWEFNANSEVSREKTMLSPLRFYIQNQIF